jgi:uncharacterized phage-associated protein
MLEASDGKSGYRSLASISWVLAGPGGPVRGNGDSRVATAHDIAAYILAKHGPMSTWKLQKLVYYSQAWALVWDEEPIFGERIEAWANGPVIRELYDRHKGRYSIDSWDGNPKDIGKVHKETIDLVLDAYGSMTGRQLSHLTHSENPWLEAREGLEPTASCNREITLDSMQAYYEALDADGSVKAVDEIDWSAVESA